MPKGEVEADLATSNVRHGTDTNHLLSEVCEISKTAFADAGFAAL